MEVLAQHRRRRSNVELRAENKRYRHLWELADKMLEMFSGDVLEDRGAGESIRELDMRCRGDLWDVCRSGDLERLETIVRIFGCSEDQWELSELKRTLLHEACENRQLQKYQYKPKILPVVLRCIVLLEEDILMFANCCWKNSHHTAVKTFWRTEAWMISSFFKTNVVELRYIGVWLDLATQSRDVKSLSF
ncbi:hypothetical protein DVH05_010287 [Phytophthora capsici]|nr:hypothetical protein DVH05_010287 [Phytophthora capsici]